MLFRNDLSIIPYSIDILFKKFSSNPKSNKDKHSFTLQNAIYLLQKGKNARTKYENKILSDYLCDNYPFFKKLRDSREMTTLEQLSNILYIQEYEPEEYIIKYGEKGDKFYILLSGKVAVYKPKYIQKEMRLWDYLEILNTIKIKDKENGKYHRLIEKNNSIDLKIEEILDLKFEDKLSQKNFNFFFEDEEEMGKFESGFSFGEIALLTKNRRNASIKSLINSICLCLDKEDYNEIVLEIEKQKFELQLNHLKIDFPIFDFLVSKQLFFLINNFAFQTFTKGEFVFKQNENSDYIYFIDEGDFEVFTLISFGWVNKLLTYIKSSKNNLVNFLLNKNEELKDNELKDLFESILQNKEKSPCTSNFFQPNNIILSNENLNKKKLNLPEFEIRDDKNLHKIYIKTIKNKEVIGLEDALEIKNRFYFVKCISQYGKIRRVSLFNMFKIINMTPDKEKKEKLIDIINEKKSMFFKQLVRKTQRIGRRIKSHLDSNYKEFLNDLEKKNKFDDVQISNNIPLINNKEEMLLKNKIKNFNKRNIEKYNKKYNSSINSNFKNKSINNSLGNNTINNSLNLSQKKKTHRPLTSKTVLYKTFSINKRKKTSKLNFTLSFKNIKLKKKLRNKKDLILKINNSVDNKNILNDKIIKDKTKKDINTLVYNNYMNFKLNSYSITDYSSRIDDSNIKYKSFKNSFREDNNLLSNKKGLKKYNNFYELMNGKKLFLKKDFLQFYDKETSADKKKPIFPFNSIHSNNK